MSEILLKTIELNATNEGPHLLISAGGHGDQFEPMVAARRWTGLLGDQLIRGHVTLVPVGNESVFAGSAPTAKDGVDLARICPGRIDGSITEQAGTAIAGLIEKVDFLIDLHTGRQLHKILPLAKLCVKATCLVKSSMC